MAMQNATVSVHRLFLPKYKAHLLAVMEQARKREQQIQDIRFVHISVEFPRSLILA